MAKKSTKEKLKTNGITPKFRVSFPNLIKPKAGFKNQEPSYSVQMLFKKAGTPAEMEAFKEFKRLAFNAAINKFGSKENFPENLKWPWKDADEHKSMKKLASHKGMWAIEARTYNRPGTLGMDKEECDPKTIYAGCFARASVNFYAYGDDGDPNVGVSCGLNNVVMVANGDKLGGATNAKDDFADLEIEEEDFNESSSDDNGDDSSDDWE